MGMPVADGIRQMAMTASDSHSRGRNFPGHYANHHWNVIPVTSVIEIQYVMAPGTGLVQKRRGGDAITIVVGGEAGSAEGDFASCMIWSTLPGRELPVLMIVTNNAWGISTSACSVHSEKHVIDRGKPFGIPGEVVDGNDPIASWHAVSRAMEHCRSQRRPFMLEATVSRLHGHSSSSGAARIRNEPDCIELFERKLLRGQVIDPETIDRVHAEADHEVDEAAEQVAREARPAPEDVERFTYAASPVDAVYPEDYTGLPPSES